MFNWKKARHSENGKEHGNVDVRFLLANERTLLSWIRTSLTLDAGGITLLHFDQEHILLALAIVVAGALTAAIGYVRYRTAERAIRTGELPLSGRGPAIVTAVVIIIALALLISSL